MKKSMGFRISRHMFRIHIPPPPHCVIIHFATSGSLETIINNTYLNCFHSLCPEGSLPPPPSSRPISSQDMSSKSPFASSMITSHKPFKHTSAHCRAVLFLQLFSTQLRAGLSLVSLAMFSHLSRVPLMLWDLPFVPLPDWFQRLWSTMGDSFPLLVLITSPSWSLLETVLETR